MYTIENETIPTTLPVLESVQLQPWFASSVLDKGLQLIREKKIEELYSLRNATGALIEQQSVVALQFDRSSKLHQGFIIRNRYCSLCHLKQDQKGCKHMAALAILSLVPPVESAKPVPAPLAFAGSGWLKIGVFLYEWLSRTPSDVTSTVKNGVQVREIIPAEGLVQAGIPESWARQADLLFPVKRQKPDTQKPKNGFALLTSQLQSWIKTPDERFLESKGWKRDSSFWIWLARMLFLQHGQRLPELHRDPVTSLFQLRLGNNE